MIIICIIAYPVLFQIAAQDSQQNKNNRTVTII